MRIDALPEERILALDPISRGFGFAVLEVSGDRLIEWGVLHCGRKPKDMARAVLRLVGRLTPTTIAIEDPSTGRSATRRVALARFAAVITDAMPGVSLLRVPRDRLFAGASRAARDEIKKRAQALFHDLDAQEPFTPLVKRKMDFLAGLIFPHRA